MDLKRRGFKFVGLTICYAFMQAVGMVNDQTADCFRYREPTGEGRGNEQLHLLRDFGRAGTSEHRLS